MWRVYQIFHCFLTHCKTVSKMLLGKICSVGSREVQAVVVIVGRHDDILGKIESCSGMGLFLDLVFFAGFNVKPFEVSIQG